MTFNNNKSIKSKFNLYSTASDLLSGNMDSSFYIEKAFEHIHGKHGSLYSNKYGDYPIERSKLVLYDSLLKKNLTNSCAYSYSNRYEPVELEKRLNNFKEINGRKQKSPRVNLSRHISINHFAIVEKKYREPIKLPKLAKQLSININNYAEPPNTVNSNVLKIISLPTVIATVIAHNKLATVNRAFESGSELSEAWSESNEPSDYSPFNMLSLSLKFLIRTIVKSEEKAKRKRFKKKKKTATEEIARKTEKVTKNNGTDELSTSAAYRASIGEVPCLYPEKKISIRFYRKKLVSDKILFKDENEASNYYSVQGFNYGVDKKSLNLNKKKMTIQRRYSIDRKVNNAFKYTQLLGERTFKSSEQAINLSFSTVKQSVSKINDGSDKK